MSFNTKLQEIRKNNNLSQEKLAEILNVSRQSVSKWERGHGYPEIDKLIFISERFNVSLDELLKDTYKPQRKPISLKKEKTIKEIYPSALPDVITSQNNSLSDYNKNLNSSNINIVPPSGKCSFKRKISKKRILLSCMLPFTVIIPIGMAVSISANNSSENYSYYESTFDDNYSYDYCDSIHRLYDEDTNTYYIFDGDSGIVDYLYTEEINEYVKLYDSESDSYKYCYRRYAEENPVFKYNDTGYIIPDYMLASSIEAENSEDYTLLYDKSEKAYFVPDYLLEQNTTEEDEQAYENENADVSDVNIEDEIISNDMDPIDLQ